MIWFSLAKMALKTGAEVYKNKKETEQLQSVAAKNHMAKMAAGEIEYQNAVRKSNDQGIKDDIVLFIVILPIVILAWSIFSGDLFFEYFNNFPEFYKWLILGIFGSIYGLKPGMDLIRKK